MPRVVPDGRAPERAEYRALAKRDARQDPAREEQVEEHEEDRRRRGDPRDELKDPGEAIPLQDHPQRRPAEEVVPLAEHDEEHARAHFPRGDPLAAAQVERDGAFADLLVDDRQDVGARADGQDVRVPKPHVEPADGAPDDEAVDQKEQDAVRQHQGEPSRPAHALEDGHQVGDEALALPGGRPGQARVEIGEARGRDQPREETLPERGPPRGTNTPVRLGCRRHRTTSSDRNPAHPRSLST